MAVEYHIYDQNFFRNTVKFEAASATAVAHILQQHYHLKSIIDVGCGCGIYLQEFQNLGVEISGYDGSPDAIKESLVGDKIKLFDLSQPLKLDRKFDLALCVEVAEHLEEKDADTLVDSLVGLSDNIIFTAAVPGQGPRSIGHINEQLPEYWIEKFRQRGFVLQLELTDIIKAEMKEKAVVWWIVQNLLIFQKES